jgi:hypothetical protein
MNRSIKLQHMRRATAIAVAMSMILFLSLGLFLQNANDLLAQEPLAVPAAQADLVINEIMADNETTLFHPDPENPYPDWIEIYNPTAAPVSLNGLSITDTPDNPTRGTIPNGYTVPANGYILFYFRADKFLDYGLSADGEFVGLYHIATATAIDSTEFGAQEPDISIGRNPNGTGEIVPLDQPTPGGHNQELPPQIVSTDRDIAVPSDTDTPIVTAEIIDDGSVVSATLVYSSTGNADASIAMTKGTGNIWQATLPAFADGTVVRYEVQAIDDEALESATRRISYVVGYVAPVLFINEIVPDNDEFGHEDIDDAGRFPDWAELYNPGDTPVSLNGLTLSDDPRNPTQYVIPNGRSVPANGYLMIYLDEEPEKTTATSKAIHTNFDLSNSGEFLGIYGGEGSALVHGYEFGDLGQNIGIGLYPDGEGTPGTMVCTTPGKTNMACDNKAMLPATFGTPEPAPAP